MSAGRSSDGEDGGSDWPLRPLAVGDHAAFVALNNTAVPHVNHLDQCDLINFLAFGASGLVAGPHSCLAAIALTFDQTGRSYASLNYRWFRDRFARFTYLDRIVVAKACRGKGYGRMIHAAIHQAASRAGSTIIGCEVNAKPANPVSFAFHRALGFKECGRQSTEDGTKSVILLRKPLSHD